MHIPLGWWTDLEVARLGGSQVTQLTDRIVVATPENPGYYWGNYVIVPADLPPAAARDLFRAEFPRAGHLSIGLLGRPDPQAWAPQTIEMTEVRLRRDAPEAPPVPGYTVRALDDADWEQAWKPEIGGPEYVAAYARGRIASMQRTVREGRGFFVGAFASDRLAAHLGIVLCDDATARYQFVATAQDHRRRGLASWLLAVAGQWAQDAGARRLVILVEPGGDAQRLYEHLGFEVVDWSFQVESTPEHVD